jgi:hypothetical protein
MVLHWALVEKQHVDFVGQDHGGGGTIAATAGLGSFPAAFWTLTWSGQKTVEESWWFCRWWVQVGHQQLVSPIGLAQPPRESYLQFFVSINFNFFE